MYIGHTGHIRGKFEAEQAPRKHQGNECDLHGRSAPPF